MLGKGENPGVMVRSLSDLFELIDQQRIISTTTEFKLKLSYMEIYNEAIRDLLSENEASLEIREDPQKGAHVVGISEMIVTSAMDVFKLWV